MATHRITPHSNGVAIPNVRFPSLIKNPLNTQYSMMFRSDRHPKISGGFIPFPRLTNGSIDWVNVDVQAMLDYTNNKKLVAPYGYYPEPVILLNRTGVYWQFETIGVSPTVIDCMVLKEGEGGTIYWYDSLNEVIHWVPFYKI